MTKTAPLIIEVLSSAHDRSAFDCGVEALNAFLKQYALQNQKKQLVRTYVCCRATYIIGYYSLTFGETKRESAPPELTRGTGNYPVPTMVLARLAVNKTEQGEGYGETLLKDAIMRTRQAADIAGLRAIVVHAKNEQAQAFYAKHGFIVSQDDPLTMFFPMQFIG